MRKLVIIYVPGLGDSNPIWQRRALVLWRRLHVRAELAPMNWEDQRPWQPKFDRLLKRIDELAAQGVMIGLVGVSAGASAAINAYAARTDKVTGIALVAGKVLHPERIGRGYYQSDPAFVTSAHLASGALGGLTVAQRGRILSRFALFDAIVSPKDSRITGARNQRIFTVGHVMTIASQLLFGAPSIIRFLRYNKP